MIVIIMIYLSNLLAAPIKLGLSTLASTSTILY